MGARERRDFSPVQGRLIRSGHRRRSPWCFLSCLFLHHSHRRLPELSSGEQARSFPLLLYSSFIVFFRRLSELSFGEDDH